MITRVYEMIAEPSSLVGAVHCKPIDVPVLEPATSVIVPGAKGRPAALRVTSALAGPSIGLSAVIQN
jgi:hypothetical protein